MKKEYGNYMTKTGGTNNKEHTKGFMFDSLVYRFKDY